MDLHDGIAHFLLQLRANGRSEHTVGQYQRHLLLLARWAAGEGLSEDVASIDHGALARFLSSPSALTCPDGRPKKAGSVNALRGSVRGFFGYLHEAGYVAEDPSRLVRRAICGAPPPRSLSRSEQERLLATLAQAKGAEAERDHALIHLLLATGARLSAALALEVGDLDLDAGEALLRRSKGDRAERLFLTPALQDHLRRFVGDRSDGALFSERRGKPITRRHAHRCLQHWPEQAGCKPVSPHGLRHSFAMRLYKETRDLTFSPRSGPPEAGRARADAGRWVRAIEDGSRSWRSCWGRGGFAGRSTEWPDSGDRPSGSVRGCSSGRRVLGSRSSLRTKR